MPACPGKKVDHEPEHEYYTCWQISDMQLKQLRGEPLQGLYLIESRLSTMNWTNVYH